METVTHAHYSPGVGIATDEDAIAMTVLDGLICCVEVARTTRVVREGATIPEPANKILPVTKMCDDCNRLVFYWLAIERTSKRNREVNLRSNSLIGVFLFS